MRPPELADDHTGTGEVVRHLVETLAQRGERYDYVCTIYATAPMLEAEDLVRGFEVLKHSDAVRAFSCTSMPFPVHRTFFITPRGRAKMFWPEHSATRSQDLPEAYQDAGQFYWERIGALKSDVAFDEDAIPVVLPRYKVQDIDSPEDWERVELMYEIFLRKKSEVPK